MMQVRRRSGDVLLVVSASSQGDSNRGLAPERVLPQRCRYDLRARLKEQRRKPSQGRGQSKSTRLTQRPTPRPDGSNRDKATEGTPAATKSSAKRRPQRWGTCATRCFWLLICFKARERRDSFERPCRSRRCTHRKKGTRISGQSKLPMSHCKKRTTEAADNSAASNASQVEGKRARPKTQGLLHSSLRSRMRIP